MKIMRKLSKAVLIILIPLLASCYQKKDSGVVVLPPNTEEAVVINNKGEVKLIDAKGEPILSCQERIGSDNECKAPPGFFSDLCKKPVQNEESGQKYRSKTTGVTPRNVKQKLCVVEWEFNPDCRTYVDLVTGQEYERCRG